MTKYETLLFLHILSVLLLVAGVGVSVSTGIAASRTNRTIVLASLASLSATGEFLVTLPGAIGTIVFGTWLADYAGFDFGAAWLTTAYILFAVALGIGSGVLGRQARRIGRKARTLQSEGVTESDELQAQAATPLISILGIVNLAIIAAFVYLMVAKPGA